MHPLSVCILASYIATYYALAGRNAYRRHLAFAPAMFTVLILPFFTFYIIRLMLTIWLFKRKP